MSDPAAHADEADPCNPGGSSDWLEAAWTALRPQTRLILTRRARQDTLEVIGSELTSPVSRERVRQIESRGNRRLLEAQATAAPTLSADLDATTDDDLLVATTTATALIGTTSATACAAMMAALGYKPARGWTVPLVGYWSRSPTALRARLQRLVDLLPLTHDQMDEAAVELGFADDPPVMTLLSDVDKIRQHDLGWVRAARLTRDVAYLWLLGEGEPRSGEEIAEVVGCAAHAVRENMRRDPAFAQIRPEGTWTLADWRASGTESRHSSALDVVVEVLRELGPLTEAQLLTEVQTRYPVTTWRIHQCLSSNIVGQVADGRWELAERGARPAEDAEPKRPDSIQCVGNVVGITLPVNHDLLRGSGLGISRWLTWHLGLRNAITSRYFELPDGLGAVRVTRGVSGSQISSLRAVAQHLDVEGGCTLALLLRTDDNTAAARHTCAHHVCPKGG